MNTRRRSSAQCATRRVVFLAFADVVLIDLVGPWEVFATANALTAPRSRPYELELVSGDGSAMIASGGGVSLASDHTARGSRGAIDTLVVPAASSISNAEGLLHPSRTLRRLAQRSRRVVSICGGAFFLAAAGLLDGRRATTHWRGVRELASRYPEIDVQEDPIFVKDGNVYTSAGATAGIDLALALVEEDLGRAVALECARDLVVFMRRPGGQSQFSATLESQHTERDALNDLIAWAADNLSSDLSVEGMAVRANMSPRNFSRVFRNEIGQTPASFVEKLRVEAARRHLEESDEALDSISAKCGFGSADSMRRSFHRVIKVAPRDYRVRFRSRGKVPVDGNP
ncbi:MAG: GlxA family transcriptional regulator [Myxococcota bacterium]|nr:GlxA family transcriptional regulator [Myxococcota bacterium]